MDEQGAADKTVPAGTGGQPEGPGGTLGAEGLEARRVALDEVDGADAPGGPRWTGAARPLQLFRTSTTSGGSSRSSSKARSARRRFLDATLQGGVERLLTERLDWVRRGLGRGRGVGPLRERGARPGGLRAASPTERPGPSPRRARLRRGRDPDRGDARYHDVRLATRVLRPPAARPGALRRARRGLPPRRGGGSPAACGGLRPCEVGGGTGELKRLWVEPEHRGRGFGRLLLASSRTTRAGSATGGSCSTPARSRTPPACSMSPPATGGSPTTARTPPAPSCAATRSWSLRTHEAPQGPVAEARDPDVPRGPAGALPRGRRGPPPPPARPSRAGRPPGSSGPSIGGRSRAAQPLGERLEQLHEGVEAEARIERDDPLGGDDRPLRGEAAQREADAAAPHGRAPGAAPAAGSSSARSR